MKKSKLIVGTVVLIALALPMSAKDFRANNPTAWTAHTVKNAIKGLYGDVEFIQNNDIVLKASKIVASGASVPLTIKSNIDAKTVSVYQNINPESAIAVWDVPKDGIIDYGLKIKLKQGNANITVVIEGRDGKFYTTKKVIKVSGGGCEG